MRMPRGKPQVEVLSLKKGKECPGARGGEGARGNCSCFTETTLLRKTLLFLLSKIIMMVMVMMMMIKVGEE